MKKKLFNTLIFLVLFGFTVSAQKTTYSENYGKALNIGLGIGGYSGYYGYVGHTLPVFNINYELSVANSFTLAPFVSFYSYKNGYYWGDNNHVYKYYYYHETVIPIGLKGTYYFDKLLKANSNWDFYLAGSLGLSIVNSSWDSDYYGNQNYYHNASSLFLDLHIGTEYHFNSRIGAFLDLSTGVSTIGLAIH